MLSFTRLLLLVVLGWSHFCVASSESSSSASTDTASSDIASSASSDATATTNKPTQKPEEPQVPAPFPELSQRSVGEVWGSLLTFPDTCILNKNPSVKQFIYEYSHYYPQLSITFVSVDGRTPRFQLFSSESHRARSLIDGGKLSEEQLLDLLHGGPTDDRRALSTQPINGWTLEQIFEYLQLSGFERSATPVREPTEPMRELVLEQDVVPQPIEDTLAEQQQQESVKSEL